MGMSGPCSKIGFKRLPLGWRSMLGRGHVCLIDWIVAQRPI